MLALLSAVALSMPQAACPMSLSQLLQLPLEQLLALQVSASASAARPPQHGTPKTVSATRSGS